MSTPDRASLGSVAPPPSAWALVRDSPDVGSQQPPIDLSATIRRDAACGLVADSTRTADYMTEGLNEALDLLERTARSLRRT